MQNRKLVMIAESGFSVVVVETISGAFAVTNAAGNRLTGNNFFTLEEAARGAMDLVIESASGEPGKGADETDPHDDAALNPDDGGRYLGYIVCVHGGSYGFGTDKNEPWTPPERGNAITSYMSIKAEVEHLAEMVCLATEAAL